MTKNKKIKLLKLLSEFKKGCNTSDKTYVQNTIYTVEEHINYGDYKEER